MLALDFAFFTPDVVSGYIVKGFIFSLQLTIVAMLGGIVLGTLLALMRLSGKTWLVMPAAAYVNTMRSVPLVMVILWFFLLIPLVIGRPLGAETSALITFTLFEAAYYSEIIRAGIQSVPKGQYEAARTLGMNYTQTMRRIILPQVIRIVLPPVSNETINLVKDTSLIYILAMNDLLRVARTIVQREFDMTPFLIAGVFYLAMTFVLTWMFKKLEAYYGKYDK